MKNQDFNLRAAFPAMPDDCRAALMDAARSLKEENRTPRKSYIAILVAAILTLMTTIAIAEGWNVLAFLGIQPDSDAQNLIQPVSVSASAGNVTLSIDSAITDGEYLAFDYAVRNNKPETPVYLVVENFTANGDTIFTDGTDDFDYQWLPGWCNDGTMMDGEWSQLPDLTGDSLHVEMIVGVYTPEKPVYLMDEFDANAIRQKWAEGYYVIVGGDGFVIEDPECELVQGFGPVNKVTGKGLIRTEMKVSFNLDLKAARASVRHPELPEPVTKDSTTLDVQSISISPLQTHIVATFTPANASYEDIVRWSDGMNFAFYDEDGNELDQYGMCLMPMSEITVEEAPDGTWYRKMDCKLIELQQSLPDTVILIYETKDGFRTELPVTLK